MDKSTSKIAFATRGTRSHFSKAGIEQTAIWSVNFPKHSKPGPIPKKPNETGNFRSNGRPKRGSKNKGKNKDKNGVEKSSKNGVEKSARNPPNGPRISPQNQFLALVQFLNFVQFLK